MMKASEKDTSNKVSPDWFKKKGRYIIITSYNFW